MVTMVQSLQSLSDRRRPWSDGGPVVYSHDLLTNTQEFKRQLVHELLERVVQARVLAAGDFDELNALLAGAEILLPDASFRADLPWPLTGVDIKLTNLVCTKLSIEDMTLEHSMISNKEVHVSIGISGLRLECDFDWWYKYGMVSDDGTGQVYMNDGKSYLSSTVALKSIDFSSHPPNSSSIINCETNIEITDMDFQGGISGTIANTFEKSIRNTVEKEVEEVACDELGGLGTDFIQDMLVYLSDTLEPYISHVPSDPLYKENEVHNNLPASVHLLNLADVSASIGDVFQDILDEANAQLGGSTDDVGGPNGDTDLGINVALREYVLDEERWYNIDIADLGLENGGTIFDSSDMLTETEITVTAVRVFGLDTFTKFDPLNAIGEQTLGNSFTIEQLVMHADLTIEIKASSNSDSIIVDPSSPEVKEFITIESTVDDIDLDASFLLALDQGKLEAIQLGSALFMEQVMPCMLSSLHTDIYFTTFLAEVSNISPPTLDGFISKGLDRIVSSASIIAFDLYDPSIMAALPGLFDTTIRTSINSFISDYLADPANVACPAPSEISKLGYVDLRDLLLNSTEALSVGGNGDGRYGDMIPMAKQLFDDFLTTIDPTTNTLNVNSFVIQPLTEAQSGENGTLTLTGPDNAILNQSSTFDDMAGIRSLHVAVHNATIRNLDAVVHPFVLLDPTGAHVIDNTLTMGTIKPPLRFGTQLSLEFDSDYFVMDDTVELGMDIEAAQIFASVMALVEAKSFMEFPVGDFMNLSCWVAMIPSPQLDGYGLRMEENATLALTQLVLFYDQSDVSVECLDCISPGMQELPNMVSLLSDTFGLIVTGFVDLVEDALTSDFAQIQIDRFLNETAAQCPHHPKFQASSTVETNYSMPEISFLTEDSWELIVLTGVTLIEAGIAVLSLNMENYVALEPDPLAAQKALKMNGTELLDLAEEGGLISSAIKEASSYLSGTTIDSSTGESDLIINDFIRSQLLDADGSLSVATDLKYESGGAKISLNQFQLKGLDSFTELNLLQVIGSQTINNEFSLTELLFEISLTIDVPVADDEYSAPSRQGGLGSSRLVENVVITGKLNDIDATLALLVAVDSNKMGALQVGSMLYSSNIVPCMLSTLHSDLNVTQLSLSIGSLEYPSVSGLGSNSLTESIENVTAIIFDNYGDSIEKAMPVLLEIALRFAVNDVLEMFKSESCPDVLDISRGKFIDFRDLILNSTDALIAGGKGTSPYGDMGPKIMDIVDSELLGLDSESGTVLLNSRVIAPLTEAQSNITGTLMIPGDLFSTKFGIRKLGFEKIAIRAYDARIANLDSIGYPAQILDPSAAYVLDNNITVGAGGKPLSVEVRLMFAVDGGGANIYNELEFSMDMESVQGLVQIMALMQVESVMNFPIEDIANLNCWIATIPDPSGEPTMDFREIAFSLAQAMPRMKCLNCTSPGMIDMVDLFNTNATAQLVTDFLNDVDEMVSSLLEGDFLQNRVDNFVVEAKTKCPHHPEYGKEPVYPAAASYSRTSFTAEQGESIVVIIAVGASSLFLFLAYKSTKKVQSHNWEKGLSDDDEWHISRQKLGEKKREQILSERTTSLVTSGEVPLLARIMVPLVVIANIGFFLSGHLSLGATVNVDVQFAGETLTIDNFFEFSMAQSTIDMWNAGAKFLAIIIVIFSGIWPYTKQLITLVLWCIPPKFISVTRRGNIFLWLDALAKWSMIDIFMLVISLAAFRVTILNPDWAFFPNLFYNIELMVIPKWGLYANMIAQLISQVSSHFIIYYHRKVVRSVLKEEDRIRLSETESQEHDAVAVKNFEFKTYDLGEKKILRKGTDYGIAFIALATIIFFICGCALASFRLELLGVLGIAVDAGDGKSSTVDHSLLSMVKLILDQARYLNEASSYVGLGSLSVLFVVTALIVPIVQIVVLMVVWFLPLSLLMMKRLFHTIELLKAWQYCEVFLISVWVTTIQLGQISSFMINDYCGSLDSFFDFMVKYGLLNVDNAQCFYVDPSLESGFYFLLFACALLLGTTVLVSKVAKAAVVERMEELTEHIKAPAILSPGSFASAFSIDPFEISSGDQSKDAPDNTVELKHVESPPTHPNRFFGFGWLLTKPPLDETYVENDNGQEDRPDDDFIFTGVIAAPQTLRESESRRSQDLMVAKADPSIDEISIMTPPYVHRDVGDNDSRLV